MMDVPTYSPREIVSELDRFIVGQNDAKRAVAIALRNRWRRQQLPEAMREEVVPKNILMIGPTGCGKTEIARRLAKLAQAPFLKVEATKFTEVGYVGRDVESIARDLVEASINMLRDVLAQGGAGAGRAGGRGAADHRAGRRAPRPPTRARKFRRMLRSGELDEQGDRDRRQRAAGHADRPARHPRHAARPGDQPGRDDEGHVRRPAGAEAAHDGGGGARGAGAARRRTGCSTTTGWRRTRWRMPRTTASCSSTRSTRSAPARWKAVSAAATCQPRGRAARPAAADRGHHGQHEIRPGEDRPCAVHRLGRVPPGQAGGPAAGVAGPPADPGRAGAAVARRPAAHPDRAGALAAEAVRVR